MALSGAEFVRLVNTNQVLHVLVGGPGRRGLGLAPADAAGWSQSRGAASMRKTGRALAVVAMAAVVAGVAAPALAATARHRPGPRSSVAFMRGVGTVGCRLEP